jgi:hypothetical protein
MLATAASTLFESTPFILAGLALGAAARGKRLTALLGCGCGSGPSARSLPAAVATGMVFGPFVALARFAAAWLAGRILRAGGVPAAHSHAASPLEDLGSLLPAAVGAGVAMHAASFYDLAGAPPAAQILGGAALAFVAAPCALGGVAVAATLHARCAIAAAGFLAVAGIADARALPFRTRARAHDGNVTPHDALAYATASTALAIVALRHGDALVHPAFCLPLGFAAIACAIATARFRAHERPRARVAPALMLAGALMSAPAPEYHATETTMTGLFAGERLTFTGALVREGARDAVVRYAITCCRADASPIVVRLTRRLAYPERSWVRVEGPVVRSGVAFCLDPASAAREPAPADPFVYR